MSQKIKLYLTGYGPFKDIKANPSQLLVELLDDLNRKGEFPNFDNTLEVVYTSILDVNVQCVQERISELQKLILSDEENTHLLIHFGVDAGISCIDLESLAHNFICDYKGMKGKIIESDKPEDQVIACKLNLEKICKDLSLNEVKVSQNAGTYLCNYVYYLDDYYITRGHKNVYCLFIHIPEIDKINFQDDATLFFKILKQICIEIEEKEEFYLNINSYEIID